MSIAVIVPKFTGAGDFTREVKATVHGYFKSHNISEKGDWRLFSKAIILFSLFFLIYYVLIFSNSPPWWIWFLSVPLLGYFVMPSIGFCVMHDAIHESFSSRKTVNYRAGLALNFLGANNFLWKTKHNSIHHTNTNIDGFDEDIEAGRILRLHPSQKWRPMHKHQHKWWYWRAAYSMLYLQWVWWNDYKKYFTRRILYQNNIKIPAREHFVFWISKVCYVAVFIVIPVVFVGWWWLVAYLAISLICSYRIALVFQLAHVVEGADQPTKESMNKEEFFIHQIKTTADFDVNNRFVSWWVGGLNFQIEHHLFPGISHVHYPVIHQLIKPILQKWGIEMNVKRTTNYAIKSHVRTLFELSKNPEEVVVQL